MKRVAKKQQKPRQVEFSFFAPEANALAIAGDFNQWNTSSHPLKRDRKGNWKISLSLNPGEHEYRFLVDGEWKSDPNSTSFSENPFGTSNSVKIVE